VPRRHAAPRSVAASASGPAGVCSRGPLAPFQRRSRPEMPRTPRPATRHALSRAAHPRFGLPGKPPSSGRTPTEVPLVGPLVPRPACSRCIYRSVALAPSTATSLCAGPPRAATGLHGAPLLRRLPSPVGTPNSFSGTYQSSCSRGSFRPRPFFAGQRAAAADTGRCHRAPSPAPPPPGLQSNPAPSNPRPPPRPSPTGPAAGPGRNSAGAAPAGLEGHIAR
jgi:hypothetical protein